jgi:hypothetical protein
LARRDALLDELRDLAAKWPEDRATCGALAVDGREIGSTGPPSPGWPHATKNDFHRPRVAADCRGYRRRQDRRGVVNADLVQGQ